MKKIHSLIYIVNILLGLVLLFDYLFIINYKMINILIYSLIGIIYILLSIKYFKTKKDINKIDNTILYIFIFSSMGLFIYNIYYQVMFSTYSFIYYNIYIFILHIIYLIYNLFK